MIGSFPRFACCHAPVLSSRQMRDSARVYPHGQILGWELGKTKPDFAAVCDWAQALGLQIIVRKPEAPEAIVIPYPDKKQLMGGRA